MAPSEARYALLVRLIWELRAIPVSSLLVFPYNAEPVLYVACRAGHREPVLAVRREEHWSLLWRGDEISVEQLGPAARRIAAEAAT